MDLLPAREELFGFSFRFFGTLFFQLLVDAPIVAEWIENLPITRAPEHVLHRHDYFCAAGGAFESLRFLACVSSWLHERARGLGQRLASFTGAQSVLCDIGWMGGYGK